MKTSPVCVVRDAAKTPLLTMTRTLQPRIYAILRSPQGVSKDAPSTCNRLSHGLERLFVAVVQHFSQGRGQ